MIDNTREIQGQILIYQRQLCQDNLLYKKFPNTKVIKRGRVKLMNNMCLKTKITYIFYLVCCAIALMMTYRHIAIYCSNEDATSVLYKSFSTATESYYPDITICLVDYYPSAQFNESRLPYNITSVDLTDMLLGSELGGSKVKEGDETHLEMLLNVIQRKNLSFEDLLNGDVKNIIGTYYTERTMPQGITQYGYSLDSSHFNKTFGSPYYNCWTRNFAYTPGEMVKKEAMTIARESLNDFRDIQITFHHPHQTLRHDRICMSDFMHVNFTEKDKLPSFIVTVNHIKFIRRRHTSHEKCDENLHHDDNRFLQVASKKLGCIPIFWMSISESWKKGSNLSYCTESSPYYLYNATYGLNWDARHLIYKEYNPPCTKMIVTYDLSPREDDYRSREHLNVDADFLLMVLYRLDEYEEIKNLQKFDKESLFSQIGGFVGIMLGVSFFSVPDIMSRIISKLDGMFK